MKLPPPFEKASDVRATLEGSINLIDPQGKSIVQIPINTAFELSPEAEGYGHGGHGFGHGDGVGFGVGYGDGSIYGHGCGDGVGDGYGDGSGKSK